LDGAWSNDDRQVLQRQQVSNAQAGFVQLVEICTQRKVRLIVLEATGGLERRVVRELVAAGLPVVVVNPFQVRNFAKALGRMAKTDAIDAEVLAEFARAVQPQQRPIPDEKAAELQEKLARRRQLVQLQTAEKNRLGQAHGKPVRRSIEAVLRVLERQLEQIDEDIDQTIQQSPVWRAKEELLLSVCGVGAQTARTLVANLPELGACSRQEIAYLAGLAPLHRESGKFRGKRSIWGGRGHVRQALYMATLTASRYNPTIRDHYRHLLAQGKLKKVALVACMRKLLVILNAMLRDSQTWNLAPQTP
jgi:transposase